MRTVVLICCLVSSLISAEVELFVYWRPEAKGQEIFLSEEKDSLYGSIRKALAANSWDICSWDVNTYRPCLFSWKDVGSWSNFLSWMGWNLPRKDPSSYWVFWSLGPKLKNSTFHRIDKKKLVLFLWEPPIVEPRGYEPKVQEQFGKIFTWDDDLVDNVRFFKIHYPVLCEKRENTPVFEARKFCALIASRLSSKHPNSLYKEREKMIRFFEDKEGEFDLYGRSWEKRGFRNYKGAIPDKLAVLQNYKFCICYENTQNTKGYITEKIFDCFAVGAVPVYWGASNVTDYIPAECFIDRRSFASDQALYDFLKGVSQEQYEAYVSASHAFLLSEKAQLFSVRHFVETFLSAFF